MLANGAFIQAMTKILTRVILPAALMLTVLVLAVGCSGKTDTATVRPEFSNPPKTTPPAPSTSSVISPRLSPTYSGPVVLGIAPEELNKLIEDGNSPFIIDVRTFSQFEKSHLISALSIPLDSLPYRYSEIPSGTPVIVYTSCAWEGDNNGARAAQILMEKGFQSVKEMKGGFSSWQKLGYPVFVNPQNTSPIPTNTTTK
jgi:rhodanese-related sulfurtransferase